MNQRQIDLIRSSFATVQGLGAAPAAIFYGHLFDADPSLRMLFKSNMAQQGERLMAMIGSALGLLDKPDTLMPVLHKLGARHVGYGVQGSHYDTVGGALLLMLDECLGYGFTTEVREAWLTLYGVIAGAMMDGAQQAEAEALAA